MNYCLKCHSIYEKAGTCNCYASTQWPVVVPIQPVFPLGDTTACPKCGSCGGYHVPGHCPTTTIGTFMPFDETLGGR